MKDLFGILAALLLVLLNGFFVLVEFAIVRVRSTKIEELARAGNPNARIVRGMIRHLDSYLAATQLGITLASLSLGWIGEPAFAGLIHRVVDLPGLWGPAVSHTLALIFAFAVITFLHILVGELAPKSIAIARAERSALWVARPMQWFFQAVHAPMRLLNASAAGLLRLFRFVPASEKELAHSEEEMKMILGESQKQGIFSFNHLLLLENTFDFGDRLVKDIMLPIGQAVSLTLQDPWNANLDRIRATRLTRYPLFDREEGAYTGLIHFKDLGMACLAQSGCSPDLPKMRRELLRIGPGAKVETLLREFQQRKTHFALVEDQGKAAGIVTLEDVIEELVGNIEDEFERKADTYLSPWLKRETVLVGLDVATRRAMINALVEALGRAVPGLDMGEAVQRVWEREKSIPTGLAKGVAIPHGRVESISKPCVAIGICRKGIDFRAGDGQPARLVFLILTPVQDAHAQVRLMARVAGLAASDYLRQRILDAETPDEVLDAVRAADSDLSL